MWSEEKRDRPELFLTKQLIQKCKPESLKALKAKFSGKTRLLTCGPPCLRAVRHAAFLQSGVFEKEGICLFFLSDVSSEFISDSVKVTKIVLRRESLNFTIQSCCIHQLCRCSDASLCVSNPPPPEKTTPEAVCECLGQLRF